MRRRVKDGRKVTNPYYERIKRDGIRIVLDDEVGAKRGINERRGRDGGDDLTAAEWRGGKKGTRRAVDAIRKRQ